MLASLREANANPLCSVPILSDDPFRESDFRKGDVGLC